MPKANYPDTRYMNTRHYREIDPELVGAFEPIDLDRMDSIRLMNRIDTKYVTTSFVLDAILRKSLACGYMMFVSEGCMSRLMIVSISIPLTSGCLWITATHGW